MTEDLVRSAASQRSNNPRVLRRVRPVPYECCGGACSFLNSGCFTLCCNGQKVRRKSSVYMPRGLKGEEDEEKEELDGQLSETTKRLIKPNSHDGLTEADLYAFERVLDSDEESQKKQRFVNSFDINLDVLPQRAESEELLNDDKIDIEDEISVVTDDTASSKGDGNTKKKKKKILNILKIRKTSKTNKDGASVTSSAISLAWSETSGGKPGDVELEKAETPQSEKDDVPPGETENSKGKGTFLSRRFHSVFSSMRGKKGKKNDEKIIDETVEVEKVIPLGLGDSSKPESPERSLELNKNAKPFWRTFSKRGKKKNNKDGDHTDTKGRDEDLEIGTDAFKVFGSDAPNEETKKKSILGSLTSKKGDGSSNQKKTERNVAQIPCLLSACVNSNIKPESARKNSSDSIEVKTIAEDDVETDENTIKIVRNQFFPVEVLRSNDRHSDVGAQGADEVEVEEREDVAEEEQVNLDEPIEEQEETVDDEMVHEEIAEEEIIEMEMVQEITEDSETQDSPVSAKKYQIFEKEDFSESLHTLVDEDGNCLLVPASALSEVSKAGFEIEKEIEIVGEDAEVFRTSCELSIREFEENVEDQVGGCIEDAGAASENVSPSSEALTNDDVKAAESTEKNHEDSADVSCIEAERPRGDAKVASENVLSSNETLTDGDIKVAESTERNPEVSAEDESVKRDVDTSTENVLSSSDTLTEADTKADESTEKNPEDSANTSWIEVANVDDLSESQFNYIYKTTLRAVEKKSEADEEEETKQDGDLEEMEKNCDVCGKSGNDEDQENLKCVCTTLTQPRRSLTEIEEGSVKTKVEAFNKSKQLILPLNGSDFLKKDDVIISEAQSSPTLGSKSNSATPSPIAVKSRSATLSSTNSEWQNPEEDMDRMIQGRGSLSGLGLRSDSMASVYSGAGEGRYGTVAVRGQVEFGLQYNYKAGALEIHVKQCKDLAPVDTKRNRSDPYVKVYLLPDKSKGGKRKTKVKKHTLNPIFDETLKFHISLNGLETRTLWLTVWHSDMFGRNDFLGEVMMSLENKVFDDPAPVWYNLQERTEPFDDTISFKGDIIVCLKFVPPDMTVQKKGKRSRGTLHVLVKEAKYLTAYKANGTSDPFCKSYLLPEKGRNSKQKTPVVKKTVNPVWNHTFIYEDVTLQELAERCLELTVWDHDRLASNEFLGGVRFSLGTGKHYGKPVEWMDATGKELTLWKSMLERPNFWVEGCLSLRPSLDARTS